MEPTHKLKAAKVSKKLLALMSKPKETQHKHLEESSRPRRRRSEDFQREKNPRHKAPLASVPTGLSVASHTTVIKVKLVFQRTPAS